MQLQLDRARDQLMMAQRAQAGQDYAAAKRHLAQAAEYMVQAARLSPPPFDRTRLATAQQIMEQARLMDQMAEAQQRQQRSAIPLGEDQTPPWLVQEKPDVRFADVAGLEDVKEQIRLKLIYPFSHPDKAQRYGICSGGGILLYGPPGTGKTLIARATAGELDASFFVAKPSDLMSKWVGEAEQNVNRLFEAARACARAVIFLDEVEAMLPKRRESNSTVMQRVVPQFLAELEGFGGKASNLLFVGATNEPWSLDPAAMRPGRFDEKIYVPLPDPVARRRILDLNLAGRPLDADVDLALLTERLAGYSGADVVQVCLRASTVAFLDAVERDIERAIAWTDFEAALAAVKPSVSAKDLERFERFTRGA